MLIAVFFNEIFGYSCLKPGLKMGCYVSLFLNFLVQHFFFFFPALIWYSSSWIVHFDSFCFSLAGPNPSTVPIPRVFFFFFFFLPEGIRGICITGWKCVNLFSTLNQCSCHWFSDNTFGVKLDLVCHVIYPTHC